MNQGFKRSTALANLLLVLATLLFSIGAFELGLRLFGRDLVSAPVTGNQYQFYRFDPELGWANEPGVRGTFSRSEFSFPLRINSAGMRGREVSLRKPAGERRISVLGDSFVWGIGAAESELLTTLIGQAFSRTEVLNFGVSGYGPVQYEKLTPAVLAYKPDVVIIGFCLGNDFVDNVLWRRYGYYKPYARLVGSDGLEVSGYPLPNMRRFGNPSDTPLVRWLYANSSVARLLDQVVLDRLRHRDDPGQRGLSLDDDGSNLYRDPGSRLVRDMVAINRLLFTRIAAAYQKADVPVLVLAVPTKCEFGACFQGAKFDMAASRRALATSLDGLPVTLIDPTDSFSLADFWNKDAHWRASGHAKAARAVIPWIRDNFDRPH